MKTILLSISAVLCSFLANCQVTLDYNGGNSRFQKVIEAPGKTTADLYKLAKRWVALTFTNPDKATYSELENEMVRGAGFQDNAVKLAPLVVGDMKYQWQIDVKEGKVRFTLSDMTVITTSGRFSFESYVFKKDGTERVNSQATNVKESFTKQASELSLSLEGSLLETTATKKDDW